MISCDHKLYLRLLVVPFLLSLIDVFVTLYYQPSAYWEGDRAALIEGNPIVWIALRIHPLLMIPGFIGWWGIVFLLLFKTASWIGLRVYVILVIGHLIGITGWLARNHSHGWALSAVIAAVAIGAATFLFLPLKGQWNGSQRVA